MDEYLRVVTDIFPDGFVFENVESLLHPTNKIIVEKFLEIVTVFHDKFAVVFKSGVEIDVEG